MSTGLYKVKMVKLSEYATHKEFTTLIVFKTIVSF